MDTIVANRPDVV